MSDGSSVLTLGSYLSWLVSVSRLRKIVTKDIGILYYGMAQNQDPHSVLYSEIVGIEELDEAGEDF
jgi:hypothetical protein